MRIPGRRAARALTTALTVIAPLHAADASCRSTNVIPPLCECVHEDAAIARTLTTFDPPDPNAADAYCELSRSTGVPTASELSAALFDQATERAAFERTLAFDEATDAIGKSSGLAETALALQPLQRRQFLAYIDGTLRRHVFQSPDGPRVVIDPGQGKRIAQFGSNLGSSFAYEGFAKQLGPLDRQLVIDQIGGPVINIPPEKMMSPSVLEGLKISAAPQLMDKINRILIVRGDSPPPPGQPFEGLHPIDGPRALVKIGSAACQIGVPNGHLCAIVDTAKMREVALLVEELPSGDLEICTAALITPTSAIAALHCAPHIMNNTLCDPNRKQPGEVSLFVMKADRTEPSLTYCVGAPADAARCDYIKVPLAESSFKPISETLWRCSNKVPEPDLVRIDWSSPSFSDVAPAEISFARGHESAVSVAGYGYSSLLANGEADQIRLRVGNRTTSERDPKNDKRIFWDADRNAGLCGGDSGGPVFAGRRDGRPNETRHLIGVMSNIKLSDTAVPGNSAANIISNCQGAKSQTVALVGYKQAVCKAFPATKECPK